MAKLVRFITEGLFGLTGTLHLTFGYNRPSINHVSTYFGVIFYSHQNFDNKTRLLKSKKKSQIQKKNYLLRTIRMHLLSGFNKFLFLSVSRVFTKMLMNC